MIYYDYLCLSTALPTSRVVLRYLNEWDVYGEGKKKEVEYQSCTFAFDMFRAGVFASHAHMPTLA